LLQKYNTQQTICRKNEEHRKHDLYTGSPQLLGYVQFSINQATQEVPLYSKCLQRVYKPLQVIANT